jgi:hypothetical protein
MALPPVLQWFRIFVGSRGVVKSRGRGVVAGYDSKEAVPKNKLRVTGTEVTEASKERKSGAEVSL